MLDIIKKSVLAGIGAIAVTEEKVRELVAEFVQKGEISQKEGETLVSDLQHVLDENKAKLTALIEQQVRKLLNELHLATQHDLAETVKALKKDVAKIEQQVAQLEKQMKSSHAETAA